jgi:hypothetical protein
MSAVQRPRCRVCARDAGDGLWAHAIASARSAAGNRGRLNGFPTAWVLPRVAPAQITPRSRGLVNSRTVFPRRSPHLALPPAWRSWGSGGVVRVLLGGGRDEVVARVTE